MERRISRQRHEMSGLVRRDEVFYIDHHRIIGEHKTGRAGGLGCRSGPAKAGQKGRAGPGEDETKQDCHCRGESPPDDGRERHSVAGGQGNRRESYKKTLAVHFEGLVVVVVVDQGFGRF